MAYKIRLASMFDVHVDFYDDKDGLEDFICYDYLNNFLIRSKDISRYEFMTWANLQEKQDTGQKTHQ